MKPRTITLFLFVSIFYNYYAQKKPKTEIKQYFVYSKPVLKVMTDNWGMYFKEDVASILDPNSKKYMFEIKLDSYGCVYPENEILEVIPKESFEGKKKNYKYLTSHSFSRQFYNYKNALLKQVEEKKLNKVYSGLLNSASDDGKKNTFFDEWDKYHTGKLITDLNRRIENEKFNKVVFFVHGYNVPYSLAVLQAITLYKLLKDTLKADMAHTLLIPVYWPSNNAKHKDLEQKDFSTKNIDSYTKNGKLFLSYSNRCYYAAITLRKIISALDSLNKGIDINIVAHSLGATIATSALINTYSKLDYADNSSLLPIAGSAEKILKNDLKNIPENDEINYDILKYFYKTALPKNKVKVFLSAAAIPGEFTFKDADPEIIKNKCFYVTLNPNDEMVTKKHIRQKTLGFENAQPYNLSVTSLGCNYNCDADITKEKYESLTGNTNCFKIKVASRETDHDIFTYMQQPAYTSFLLQFFNHQ